jgi:hypothetical protein
VDALERLAWGLAATDQFDDAAWFFGASEAQRDALGIGLRLDETTDHARQLSVARARLGDAFDATWTAGRGASLEDAVACGLATTP